MTMHFTCMECKRIFEKETWKNPKFCSKTCAQKYHWRDPEYRQNHLKKMKAFWKKQAAQREKKEMEQVEYMAALKPVEQTEYQSLGVDLTRSVYTNNEVQFSYSRNGSWLRSYIISGYEEAVTKFAELYAVQFGVK